MNVDSEEVRAATVDPKKLRQALGCFPTGVTVVTTRRQNGQHVGVTANSFNSVSLSPPLILWSLSQFSTSYPAFQESTYFAINVLAADQQEISNQFARSGIDKFAGVPHHPGAGGVPLIDGSAAAFVCRSEFRYYGGDHVIMVGAVIEFDYFDRPPLCFSRGQYAEIKASI
jgi:3-hydroxy-9,10-secoandrosta-1,3,5(10)-triene-9,17-dione monooxygenase reductase component